MKYELTPDLLTGNDLIDSEHKELFNVVNNLTSNYENGTTKEYIKQTSDFLVSYVNKHFDNEEMLQSQNEYPNYAIHKIFHQEYKQELMIFVNEIEKSGLNAINIYKFNKLIEKLIKHIKTEDKNLALYINK